MAVLEHQVAQLRNRNGQLEQQLTAKNGQLKQNSRKLRKTSSKLVRREEECQSLREELRRVGELYSQKVQQLAKEHRYWQAQEEVHQTCRKKGKKTNIRHTEIQCELVTEAQIDQLQQQNRLLREKLEKTQRELFDEQCIRKDLDRRLEALNTDFGSYDE